MNPSAVAVRTSLAALSVGVASLLLFAPGASAAAVLDEALSAEGTHAGACSSGLGGKGTATRSFTAPNLSYLRAELGGGNGDWDLAVFSDRTGEAVTAAAGLDSSEVATGFAFAGEQLTAQICRRAGASGSPQLRIELTEITDGPSPAPSLVRVATEGPADLAKLEATGIDVSHNVRSDYADVVAYGEPDLEKITRIGLPYNVRTKNLSRQSRADRARELSAPSTYAAGEGFPSGRTGSYRHLVDYEEEMKALAEQYPNIVRVFTLPEKTYEGREVMGIEITRNVGVRNGKPTFMQMGLHHAREWPSGEHAIEWAYEILNGFEAGDERATELVQKTRTVVIPVVNPDGFNASREAGELQGAGGGRASDGETLETVNIVTHPVEYRRKNCRFLDDSEGGSCVQPDVGLAAAGVDPNRNYGGLWGGPGASSDPTAADYRGPGPFSEPESRNIQHYLSRHQITAYLSNHTFTGLWLRPPGVASFGDSIDEKVMKRLGAKATAENGYENIQGFQLYDTTGTTEDWGYGTAGAIGYTPEIGALGFHPPYDVTIAEWTGDSAEFESAGGNREAYYQTAEFVRKRRSHALIEGKGPKGGRVILSKRFETETSPVLDTDGGTPGEIQTFDDRLRTVARIRKRGRFSYVINPSTRPVVALDKGEQDAGPPSDPESFAGDATTTTPCADAATEDPGCFNDHPFTVPDEAGRSNAEALIRLEWATEATDWDMTIYRDSDGDGTSVGETEAVGASANGPSSSEQATIAGLEPGEKYVIRVINFAAFEPYEGTITYQPPQPFEPGVKERWKLVVKDRKGQVVKRRSVYIERGETKTLDLREKKSKGKKK